MRAAAVASVAHRLRRRIAVPSLYPAEPAIPEAHADAALRYGRALGEIERLLGELQAARREAGEACRALCAITGRSVR